MKFTSSIFALATLAAILPAQAQQKPYQEGKAPAGIHTLAVSDPLKIIYHISGVTDTGDDPNVGVATSIHCTNFGTVPETVKFVIRFNGGTAATSRSTTLNPGETKTASTHFTVLFFDDLVLTPGIPIRQGDAAIVTTSPQKVFCSAMIVDASILSPEGISLHMVRLNPITGSQE